MYRGAWWWRPCAMKVLLSGRDMETGQNWGTDKCSRYCIWRGHWRKPALECTQLQTGDAVHFTALQWPEEYSQDHAGVTLVHFSHYPWAYPILGIQLSIQPTTKASKHLHAQKGKLFPLRKKSISRKTKPRLQPSRAICGESWRWLFSNASRPIWRSLRESARKNGIYFPNAGVQSL